MIISRYIARRMTTCFANCNSPKTIRDTRKGELINKMCQCKLCRSVYASSTTGLRRHLKKQTRAEATTTILTAASASIAASTAAVLHLKRGIRFFWMVVSAVSTKTPTAVSAVLYLCEKHIQLFWCIFFTKSPHFFFISWKEIVTMNNVDLFTWYKH